MLEFRAWNISRYHRHKSGLHGAWDVLRDIGVLDTDKSLRAAIRLGQLTTEELVAQHQIQSAPVRDMLIRYLNERRPGMDFSSFRQLTSTLAARSGPTSSSITPASTPSTCHQTSPMPGKPGSPSPRENEGRRGLGRAAWRSSAGSERSTSTSRSGRTKTPPGHCGQSAARSAAANLKASPSVTARGRRKCTSASASACPTCPCWSTRQKVTATIRPPCSLLVAKRPSARHSSTPGRTYRRARYRWDTRSKSQHGPDAVLVTDEESGERIELLRKEEDAFWAWAIIETLRHTGVRVEELLELTHLALVSYRLPDSGERSFHCCRSCRPRAMRSDCSWSTRSWPACWPPWSAGSGETTAASLWRPATTHMNA